MFKFGILNLLFAFAVYVFALISFSVGGSFAGANEMHFLVIFAMAFTCYYALAPRRAQTRRILPAFSRDASSDFAVGFGIGTSIYFIVVALTAVFCGPPFVPDDLVVLNAFPFVLIFSVAAMEEIIFRGYLLGVLRAKLPWVVAIIISAVLFAAAHGVQSGPIEFISRVILGIFLGIIVWDRSSILPAIIIHGGHNYGVGLSKLGLEAPYAHPGVFQFTDANANTVFLMAQVLIMAACVCYMAYSRRRWFF